VSEGSIYLRSEDFSCRDLDINLMMTLELERDLHIMKMYLYTENEVARLRHLKLLIEDEMRMTNKKYENSSSLKVKVKCHQLSTTSSVHHGTYSYQVTSISDR